MKENVTITLKIELTAHQYGILRHWDNVNEWLTMQAEKEIYKFLEKHATPTNLE